jgi:enamine deaminase RidA (YjgF/YER057c/UK114 family)
MSGTVEARLAELGLELPPPFAPVATYLGYTVTGNLVHVSGQGPVWGSELRFSGKVGAELSFEQGCEAARLTALNLLAHLREACGGDLDRVVRCVKLFGLVHSTPDFTDAHKVVDAGSALLVDVFGEAGRHARAVVGAPGLPFGIAVELEAIFEID